MAHVTHYQQVYPLTIYELTDRWNGVPRQNMGFESDAFGPRLRGGAPDDVLVAVFLINLLLDHLVNRCRKAG